MSTFQSYDARLLQGGLLGGWNLAQQADQFSQRQAIDEARLQEQLRMARDEAMRDIDEREAESEIIRALGSFATGGAGPAGPRPQQVGPTGQMQGPMPQSAVAEPDPAMMDPLAGLRPEAIKKSGARTRSMLAAMAADRARFMQERADGELAIQTLQGAGMTRFIPKEQYAKFVGLGLGGMFTEDDIPIEVRNDLQLDQEQERMSLLTLLASDASPDGGMGPVQLNEAAIREYGSLPLPELRFLYRQKKQAELQRQENEAVSRARSVRLEYTRAQPWFNKLPQERRYVVEQDIMAGRDVSLESVTPPAPRVDTTIDNRVSLREKRAKEAMDFAAESYKAINLNDDGNPAGISPPTPQEITIAQTPKDKLDPWGLGNKVASMEDWERARAKVRAWNEYAKARHQYDLTLQEGEAMFKGERR